MTCVLPDLVWQFRHYHKCLLLQLCMICNFGRESLISNTRKKQFLGEKLEGIQFSIYSCHSSPHCILTSFLLIEICYDLILTHRSATVRSCLPFTSTMREKFLLMA